MQSLESKPYRCLRRGRMESLEELKAEESKVDGEIEDPLGDDAEEQSRGDEESAHGGEGVSRYVFAAVVRQFGVMGRPPPSFYYFCYPRC